MKKWIAVILCFVSLSVLFAGCKDDPATPQNSDDPDLTTQIPVVTEQPSASPSEEPTQEPTASPSPVPTPTPSPRPAQTESIVPDYLLSVGFTTPLGDVPKGYKMAYYIEVDVTNQCVNVFIKNNSTGKYDVLLNRFVCSGGTSTQPTKLGNFYIKSNAEQRAATGQDVKYRRYYFKKYQSYAYYVTRYSNEYMFHSYTFAESNGYLKPKSAYYNMGNPGSAGCLRMLMNHAKWIYDNVDPGTYVVVNKQRAKDKTLQAALKKIPPLGYDMTSSFNPDTGEGLVVTDPVKNPEIIGTVKPTPSETAVEILPTPTPTPTPTITVTPTPTPTHKPTPTPTPTPTQKPTPTPSPTSSAKPDPTPTKGT